MKITQKIFPFIKKFIIIIL